MKVNQPLPKKRLEILELLYNSTDAPVSGVRISEIVQISRVAVWKHIKALQQAGVDIEAQSKGYQLQDQSNLLYPFCFSSNRQNRMFHFPELGSTMDQARIMAREGAAHGTCIIAEVQTKARGRLNRPWSSGAGGLWFTLILKPDLPPPLAWTVNFTASACMADTLSQLFGLDVRVKWPNDLLLDGKKLSGMLSEMKTRADMVDVLLQGIGLNVNNTPDSDRYQAISVKQALGRIVSRRQILMRFLDLFENRMEESDPARIIRHWKKKTSTIGTRVRVQTRDHEYQGMALDVDDTGALVIEEQDGTVQKIIYGDCFHA